jgi:uncharacterized OsmC-like protein
MVFKDDPFGYTKSPLDIHEGSGHSCGFKHLENRDTTTSIDQMKDKISNLLRRAGDQCPVAKMILPIVFFTHIGYCC